MFRILLVCRGAYIPYFKINAPICCCPFFSENYLNPQARISKMVNKHTVDYHPSPSELISRITPSYFYGLQRGLSRRNFFINLYIPPWLWKSFKFMLLRLLANTFVSQKIESVYFYSCPKAKLALRFSSEITHSSRAAFWFLFCCAII